MPKLKSVEELRNLRAQVQKDLTARTETTTTITVGMGTCGISAGAREVMQAVLQELNAREIKAHVTTVGCIGMCSKEPLLDIQQGDEPRITYGNVTPKMVPRIIEEHVIHGRVVDDWVVGRIAMGQEE
ncbi:MAG TPA: (2Fe-2S) ferredoxin domain-containing protein [Chloroflexi bacterium]|nr:(2Fe-2S) ferredoxin domain-containing protein [Chloroflexota bacterium]